MKQIMRSLYLQQTFIVLFAISLIIKFIPANFTFFRGYFHLFLLIDMIISFFAVIGCYFFLNEYLRVYGIIQGHILIIMIWVFFNDFTAFILSAVIKRKKKYYYQNFGILFMNISCLITVFFISKSWEEFELRGSELFIIFMVNLIFSTMFCYNNFLILNYRQNKFYMDESIYGFYSNFSDFLFTLWKDIYNNLRLKVKTNGMKSRRKSKKKKKKIRIRLKEAVKV